MKLGVYIHLGPLYGGGWSDTRDKAKTLRDAGVRHVFAANAAVDTVAMARGNGDWLRDWKGLVEERLGGITQIGLKVGVRPMPLCAEQVVIQETVFVTGIGAIGDAGSVVTSPTETQKRHTPDFTIRRTSIDAAKTLTLGDHYLYACHEVHDILDCWQRRWLVDQLGPRTIIYYGHRGLWNKYGADFGESDLPHIIHVALNAAGVDDKAEDAKGPFAPRDCTAKQIREFCKVLEDRLVGTDSQTLHAHINVTAATSVARMVAMAYEAVDATTVDVLMFRNVDDKGNTVHEVPANVLEAIKELDGVA